MTPAPDNQKSPAPVDKKAVTFALSHSVISSKHDPISEMSLNFSDNELEKILK
jgi:hypothetical protein